MIFIVAVLTLFLAVVENSAHAQERIRIAWARATPTNAPIWVVEERKLSKKHGLDGVKTLLEHLAPKNPKLGAADPKSFIDTSLVQEVEASGFLKQLYQR